MFPIKVDRHITGFSTRFPLKGATALLKIPRSVHLRLYVVCRSRYCRSRRRLYAKRNKGKLNLRKHNARKPNARKRTRHNKNTPSNLYTSANSEMTSADKFARNARNRLKRSYHPIRVRVDTGKSIDDFYMNISRSAWQTVKLPAKWFQQLKTKHFDVHVLCISGCNSPEIWVVGTKRAPSKLCPRRKNKTNMSKLHISKQKLKNRCRKRKPSLIIRY